ncbi:hypothetical protein EDD18DRAFT_1114300 [Armillaria luteobubalina]|uniref:Uncharacterized protein n=1 Tax=Armillaria luteobubalina TaxID=153913 RepID=A0AA39UGM3_9AGAR|nr:hypothetical protein EDD18DRAFT_1114300 [Armillaria luteobubalina]
MTPTGVPATHHFLDEATFQMLTPPDSIRLLIIWLFVAISCQNIAIHMRESAKIYVGSTLAVGWRKQGAGCRDIDVIQWAVDLGTSRHLMLGYPYVSNRAMASQKGTVNEIGI